MKLSIFIGNHKTGSTAVQAHFARHRLDYLRRGVLYPMVEGVGLSMFLSEALIGRSRHDDFRGLNLREPHNALAFRMLNEASGDEVPPWHPNLPSGFQMFCTIAAQIEALRPDHLVLCSEVFCRFALEQPERTLGRLMTNLGAEDVTLVLNLRRPDRHLASWHLQRLKFGHPIRPLSEGAYEDYLGRVHFQYARIVEGLRKHAPYARLVVRNYDDLRRAGGSVHDFLARTGIEPCPIEDEEVNSSVPHAVAPAILALGRQSRDQVMLAVEHVLAAGSRLSLPDSSTVELFGPQHRARLVTDFAPIHAELGAALDIDGFFPDIDQMAQCNPIPEAVAAKIGLAALKADVAEFGQIKTLRQAVAGLELTSAEVPEPA